MSLLHPRCLPLSATAAFAAAIACAAIAARRPAAPHHAPNGAALFHERCAICHSTQGEAGQGPGLGGVVGRTAGAGERFGYSRALRKSALVWDEAALTRFLAAPAAMVPGTTMPVAVTDDAERRALVAYLATLPASVAPPEASAPPPSRWGSDFRTDAPGVRHRVETGDLPAPYANPSAHNAPVVVDPPPHAHLDVPPGFEAHLFASALSNPRLVRVAPNGDVFVAETGANRIRVLRAPPGASAAAQVEVFATALDGPFGIAFFPPNKDPEWVYVANRNSIVRFPYRAGDLAARGPAQIVVPQLTDEAGGHTTRDVVFSLDGARMFVSVGSGTNVAEGMRLQSAAETAAWEEAHGVGAAWGDETDRADVLVFDPQGKDGHVFASGIRNCVGLAVHPGSGDLWCATNERDGLGDDLVPDYVTRVGEGAFYGWPWYYLGGHEDPRHAGERPDLAAKVHLPDVLLQSHSAPLAITFYGAAMFPPAYRGSAFVALHGSWNRSTRTGPKVVRIFVHDGAPAGDYEDFVTGFVVDRGHVWGRPVGVAVANDGALLVTEDGNGTVWRIAYGTTR